MLDRIKSCLPSLAPAEQRVGKLVLSDARAFANLPISELADRAHVSKPTVVRFCRSLGYDGLSDFKLKLAGSVSEGVPMRNASLCMCPARFVLAPRLSSHPVLTYSAHTRIHRRSALVLCLLSVLFSCFCLRFSFGFPRIFCVFFVFL